MTKKLHPKNKKSAPTYCSGLLATLERQHQCGGVITQEIHEIDGNNIYIRRHSAKYKSVLDFYKDHDTISELEYTVGDKFYREYARSVLKIKTMDTGAGSHGDLEYFFLSAINGNQYLRVAYNRLAKERIKIIVQVCVENEYAVGKKKTAFLRESLRMLAKRWGYL